MESFSVELDERKKTFNDGDLEEHYLQDYSDMSDISPELSRKMERWLQQSAEDGSLVLRNGDSDANHAQAGSSKRKSKPHESGFSNIRFRKAAVKAARKQSKELLEKICKKIFQPKIHKKSD
ncbi:hypothetical protein CEXT_26761 [Caerostris extrusa]|uniref:Uncharacterized protein n=1 Tax=Caerostris extrusa TaxID=172846 RepID=A0AAV4XX10_CAEEX|nr:hypothetical protein CEXT_26761 [Caerostris extrusa]